jgi:hypothetical protein
MNERTKELAEQAGLMCTEDVNADGAAGILLWFKKFDLERFAELVRQDEREACAKHRFDTPESHIVKWSIPVDPNNFGEPLAQPEQEPVAWVTGYKNGHCVIALIGGNTIFQTGLALYTAPPKREWVGLTDLEVRNLFKDVDWVNEDFGHLAFYRAIEAAFKEKNT